MLSMLSLAHLNVLLEVKGVTGPPHVSVECVFHFLGDGGTHSQLKDSSHLVSDFV